jgi:hypothetical protein
VRVVRGDATTELRPNAGGVVSVPAPAWDTERAAELASKAYSYVGKVYPKAAGYDRLDEYTEAAHAAQDAGDVAAFEDALRELMRAARREALKRRGAA